MDDTWPWDIKRTGMYATWKHTQSLLLPHYLSYIEFLCSHGLREDVFYSQHQHG